VLKVAVAVVVVALVGSASAAGWRSMRFEAKDEASFATSVAAFQQELSPARRRVFTLALTDLWEQGTELARAQQRAYSRSVYFQRLDGRTYDEILALADPTGETNKARYREASLRDRPPPVRILPPNSDPIPVDDVSHADAARHRRRPEQPAR
jgi:hypothetical protein